MRRNINLVLMSMIVFIQVVLMLKLFAIVLTIVKIVKVSMNVLLKLVIGYLRLEDLVIYVYIQSMHLVPPV